MANSNSTTRRIFLGVFGTAHVVAAYDLGSICETALAALHAKTPTSAYQILTAQGLVQAITAWDTNYPSNKFSGASEEETKSQVTAFLAHVYRETLRYGGFDLTRGLNEIACDDAADANHFSAGIQSKEGDLAENGQPQAWCKTADSVYGSYWGRGAIQLTKRTECSDGSVPGQWDWGVCQSGYNINVRDARFDLLDEFFKEHLRENHKGASVYTHPQLIALDPTLAWASGLIHWMTARGSGCYTSHQWAQMKDFAGTIENVNGGWANGEAPLSKCTASWDCSRQQDRIDAFKTVASALNLSNSGWNGLVTSDPCPCEKYYEAVEARFNRQKGYYCTRESEEPSMGRDEFCDLVNCRQCKEKVQINDHGKRYLRILQNAHEAEGARARAARVQLSHGLQKGPSTVTNYLRTQAEAGAIKIAVEPEKASVDVAEVHFAGKKSMKNISAVKTENDQNPEND